MYLPLTVPCLLDDYLLWVIISIDVQSLAIFAQACHETSSGYQSINRGILCGPGPDDFALVLFGTQGNNVADDMEIEESDAGQPDGFEPAAPIDQVVPDTDFVPTTPTAPAAATATTPATATAPAPVTPPGRSTRSAMLGTLGLGHPGGYEGLTGSEERRQHSAGRLARNEARSDSIIDLSSQSTSYGSSDEDDRRDKHWGRSQGW
ncbi:hypothetical protein BCR39DRAFT_503096 [Naematelia encephala]|uniref:Uncharacterized protein n=1 Tax=Naematelia encephala TaxID=71784 RepID=A0A1Y2BME7_9TREE|nr:hypothetical protein BCR39DRAFT_503096 [Naematelia encephala]